MRKMRKRPIQIYLRPDQDTALRAMAKNEKVAIAASPTFSPLTTISTSWAFTASRANLT